MGLSAVAGGIIQSGLNLLGGLGSSGMTAAYNAKEAQKDRDFQKSMYEQQVQDNLKFWNLQNEFNLPSAQLQRIKDSGLNPLLMYGGSGLSGNLASQAPQPAQAPHGSTARSQFQNPMDMANLSLLQAQTEVLKSEAEKNKQDVNESKSRENTNLFDLDFKKTTREINVGLLSKEYDLKDSMISLNREQRYYIANETNLLLAQIDKINADIKNQTNLTEAQVKDISTRLDKFLEEFPHVINNLDSQTRKNLAEAISLEIANAFNRNLLTSDYATILKGQAGQDLLNAIKYGTAQDIENGIRALEFMRLPKPGEGYFKYGRFMEYGLKPALETLKDVAVGGAALYMGGKFGFKKVPKVGFKTGF